MKTEDEIFEEYVDNNFEVFVRYPKEQEKKYLKETLSYKLFVFEVRLDEFIMAIKKELLRLFKPGEF